MTVSWGEIPATAISQGRTREGARHSVTVLEQTCRILGSVSSRGSQAPIGTRWEMGWGGANEAEKRKWHQIWRTMNGKPKKWTFHRANHGEPLMIFKQESAYFCSDLRNPA